MFSLLSAHPCLGLKILILLRLWDHQSSVIIRFAPLLPPRTGLSAPQNFLGLCAMTAQSLLGGKLSCLGCKCWRKILGFKLRIKQATRLCKYSAPQNYGFFGSMKTINNLHVPICKSVLKKKRKTSLLSQVTWETFLQEVVKLQDLQEI